jgi:hypothetical protein
VSAPLPAYTFVRSRASMTVAVSGAALTALSSLRDRP